MSSAFTKDCREPGHETPRPRHERGVCDKTPRPHPCTPQPRGTALSLVGKGQGGPPAPPAEGLEEMGSHRPSRVSWQQRAAAHTSLRAVTGTRSWQDFVEQAVCRGHPGRGNECRAGAVGKVDVRRGRAMQSESSPGTQSPWDREGGKKSLRLDARIRESKRKDFSNDGSAKGTGKGCSFGDPLEVRQNKRPRLEKRLLQKWKKRSQGCKSAGSKGAKEPADLKNTYTV